MRLRCLYEANYFTLDKLYSIEYTDEINYKLRNDRGTLITINKLNNFFKLERDNIMKVKCIRDNNSLTSGKVYNVKDRKICDDHGNARFVGNNDAELYPWFEKVEEDVLPLVNLDGLSLGKPAYFPRKTSINISTKILEEFIEGILISKINKLNTETTGLKEDDISLWSGGKL